MICRLPFVGRSETGADQQPCERSSLVPKPIRAGHGTDLERTPSRRALERRFTALVQILLLGVRRTILPCLWLATGCRGNELAAWPGGHYMDRIRRAGHPCPPAPRPADKPHE
jgi:hypothetical protein